MRPETSRRLRRLLWIGAALGALLGLAVVALVWRLHQGPIRIDFLQPRIEAALDELIAPVSVKLGGTTVDWVGGGRPVEVRVTDVEVLGPAGDRLVGLAEIGIGLSAPALLRGRLVPSGLVVRETQAVIERREDGSFELGFVDVDVTPGQAEPAGGLKEWLDAWLEQEDPDAPLARLATLSIADSRLRVHDRMTGVDWGADGVDISLTRQDRVLNARASLSLNVGDHSSLLTVDAAYGVTDGRFMADVGFDDLVPAAFAQSYPGLEPLAALDDPLKGTIELSFRDASSLHAKLDLEGQPGVVSATVEMTGGYSSFEGTLDVKQLAPRELAGLLPELAQLARVPFNVDGEARFSVADRKLKSLEFDVTGGSGKLLVPELYAAALMLRGTRIKGSIAADFAKIEIERAEVNLHDVQVTARLSAHRDGDVYRGRLGARLGRASTQQVGEYWPVEAGTGARRWVVEHITAGTVTDIELDMAADVTMADPIGFDLRSLSTTFGFAGLHVDALSPQPPITGLDGRATITTERFAADIERGGLRELEIAPSKFAIGNLSGDGPAELSLDLAARAPLGEIVTLLSDRPLELVPDDLLAGLGGQAELAFELRLPLVENVARRAIRTAARARLRDVVWRDSPVPLGDRTVTAGDLALVLDDDALEVNGTLEISGIPARVELWHNLTETEPADRVVAHLRVDDDARRALELPTQDYWSGATEVELTYVRRTDGSSSITADGDLANAALAIPELKWRKPAGVAGHANVIAELDTEGPWRIEKFDASAGDLTTSGALELDPHPVALRRLRIDRFALAGTDLHGTVSFDASAGYRIRIEGSSFDVVPLIDYLEERSAEAEKAAPISASLVSEKRAAIDLELRLDRLRASDTSTLSDLSARASFDGVTLQELEVRAAMDPKSVDHPQADNEARTEVEPGVNTKLELRHAPEGSGHRFVFATDNLGGLIEGLTESTAIEAGNVTLTAQRESADGPWTGDLEATHFTLREAPILAKLLQLSSIQGIASALSQDGLWFKRVDVDLVFHDGHLELKEGRAVGKGFAITSEGFIDIGKREVGLSGAVIPMATVNKVIGHIPLIGRLLTGWDREGIIAVLYSLTGPLAGPEINVKKSSVLTPGITREIHKLDPDHASKKGRSKNEEAENDDEE